MSGCEEKMGNMGITLPRTPTPAAAYIPAKKSGKPGILFRAGTFCRRENRSHR